MMLLDPSKISDDVTPPEAMILITGSYGFMPLMARTKGVIGPNVFSFTSLVAGN